MTFIDRIPDMIRFKSFMNILLIVAMLLAWPAMGQSAASEPRAIKGGKVVLQFKNIPAEDVNNVNGEYAVSREDGTISVPYLSGRVRVMGMTARQLENTLRSLYLAQKIYADPIVMATVGHRDEAGLDVRYVQVAGYVAQKRNLQYREGITLIQALLDCGDITDYGSRRVQITRGKVTRTYDYFSARDRAIKLLPDDVIYVPRRPAFEGRPDTIGP